MNACQHHAAKFAATVSNLAAGQASWTCPASEHTRSLKTRQYVNGKCSRETQAKVLP